MDRDAEITEIRRELDILRARHALYTRWGGVLKAFFTVAVPLFAIALAVAEVVLLGADPLYASFFVLIVVALCAIVYLFFSPNDHRRGWIDLASPPIRFAYPPSRFPPFLFAARPSDALAIEEQIAVRERRLIELGARP